MKGKERCKILKDIRRQIAENNDIEFVTSECKHKGDCLGTCPKCEDELRYLERELEKKQRLGKAVMVAGLAVSITAATAGCDMFATAGNMQPDGKIGSDVEELMGDVPIPYPGEIEIESGETDGVLIEPFKGELIAAPSIEEITAEKAMDSLRYMSREFLRSEWSFYSVIENGQSDRVDLYLREDDTLIRLEYDESDVLVKVEMIHDYRTEW